jgi:hypothetical protein
VGRKEAESSVEEAANAGTSLESIITAVGAIADMNLQIAAAAQQQSNVAEEMNENITHINQMATETAEGALQTSTTSEKTLRQVEGVRMIAEQFKVHESELDLSAFKAGHLAWQPRLREMLDGTHDLVEDGVHSHTECELGKWFYGEGRAQYGHFQEMVDLEDVHQHMHDELKAIVRLYHQNKINEAEERYNETTSVIQKVGNLIDKIELRASRQLK